MYDKNYKDECQSNNEDEYLEDLIRYAKIIGVNAEDIDYLLDKSL